ncbi:dephospho-CoA kinase [Rhodohalobacter sp. 614A]|uniref:dephospho-CoA kinase n=1 Tax=Rhodohalobacter sp. 614A TaxID=2908649 RepID=UPI001EEB17F3|nr:dephospho-CoA kinase [Rhodohalobacter sp. 614A]
MITVGVTGGIGSGKTTVCKEWEKLGAKVVYADDLAKNLMTSDSDLKQKLVKAFGRETYHEDGSLNRPHLIRHAFEEDRVEELNKLVHPAVAKKFKEISEQAKQNGEKILVEEAALLLNNGRPSFLDIIVLVKSNREKRIERVVERDGVSSEKVLDRDKNQPDFNNLSHLVDYTIENNGTLNELKEKSGKLFDLLMEIARK